MKLLWNLLRESVIELSLLSLDMTLTLTATALSQLLNSPDLWFRFAPTIVLVVTVPTAVSSFYFPDKLCTFIPMFFSVLVEFHSKHSISPANAMTDWNVLFGHSKLFPPRMDRYNAVDDNAHIWSSDVSDVIVNNSVLLRSSRALFFVVCLVAMVTVEPHAIQPSCIIHNVIPSHVLVLRLDFHHVQASHFLFLYLCSPQQLSIVVVLTSLHHQYQSLHHSPPRRASWDQVLLIFGILHFLPLWARWAFIC